MLTLMTGRSPTAEGTNGQTEENGNGEGLWRSGPCRITHTDDQGVGWDSRGHTGTGTLPWLARLHDKHLPCEAGRQYIPSRSACSTYRADEPQVVVRRRAPVRDVILAPEGLDLQAVHRMDGRYITWDNMQKIPLLPAPSSPNSSHRPHTRITHLCPKATGVGPPGHGQRLLAPERRHHAMGWDGMGRPITIVASRCDFAWQ